MTDTPLPASSEPSGDPAPALPEFPPAHHLMRSLAPVTTAVGDDEFRLVLPVTPEVRVRSGAARTGLVLTAVDIVSARFGLAHFEPDWMATTAMSYRGGSLVEQGPVVMSARVLRGGSRSLTVRVEVFDGRGAIDPAKGTPAGVAIASFARIPGAATTIDAAVLRVLAARRTMVGEPVPLATAVLDAMGVVERAPGVVEIHNSGFVSNSFGTLHGGATALTVEAAARSALGGLFDVVDAEVRYLAQAGVGPVRSRAAIVREDGRTASVEVSLHDAGADEPMITHAFCTCVRVADGVTAGL